MKKVLAAVSGGVDSAVALLLLLQQGYQVTAVTMRLTGEVETQAERDAAALCRHLGVEHHVLPLQTCFSRQVIERFVQGYLRGETPNPCLDCNRYLKFGALLEAAQKFGAERVATGHYAQIDLEEKTGRSLLRKGIDPAKDQSYVLYALTQAQLRRILLPLGAFRKEEIRAMARTASLPMAEAPESQDICFVPDGDYGGFITRWQGEEAQPGPFINRQGQVLGTHRGQFYYTPGQRRGLGVSAEERLYVLKKDAKSNCVLLGKNEELFPHRIRVREINWIAIPGLARPETADVMVRYRAKTARALLYPEENDMVTVEFQTPARAPAPGQAAVFYQGDTVLGGGIIDQILEN